MEKNDLKLDWQRKYWLLQAIGAWNPILDPPDPETHEAQISLAWMEEERTIFDPKPKRTAIQWSFMVDNFAIYRPGQHELFIPPMAHGMSPEIVVEEWWEKAVADNSKGSLLVSYDSLENEGPTVETDGLQYFKFSDGKFVEVDREGDEYQAHPDRGECRFEGGNSSSIGISGHDGDAQVPGKFLEINFGRGAVGGDIGGTYEIPTVKKLAASSAYGVMKGIPAGKSGQIAILGADGSIGWIDPPKSTPIGIALEDGKKGDLVPVLIGKSSNPIPESLAISKVDLTPVSREFWEALKRFEEHLHEAKFTPYNEPITDEALRKISRGVFEVGHAFEVASGLALKGIFMFYSDARNSEWSYIDLDPRHFSPNARMVLKYMIEKFPHLMMRPKDVETLPGLPNLKEWQSIRFDRIASGDLKEGDLVAIGPDRTVFKSKGSSS